MDFPGEHALSHNILGFSRPVGLSETAPLAKRFVELYSVVYRVKEKGICVCLSKMKLLHMGFKAKPPSRVCAIPPQGTMVYLSLPEQRTT